MSAADAAVSWGLDAFRSACVRRFNPVYAVTRRLHSLVAAHDLTLTQLLRHVPSNWGWSLANLKDDDALLHSLNAETLAWLADWFGVELAWLGAKSHRIYGGLSVYKRLPAFWTTLGQRGFDHPDLQVYLFTSSTNPSEANVIGRELALVFSAPAPTNNGDEVTRFAICDDSWTWNHPPCELQLKQFALAAWHRHQISIPIVPVAHRTVLALRSGTAFPTLYLPRPIGHLLRLEDLALADAEADGQDEANWPIATGEAPLQPA